MFFICDHKEPKGLILVIVKSSILVCEESVNYNLKLLLSCCHGFCTIFLNTEGFSKAQERNEEFIGSV